MRRKRKPPQRKFQKKKSRKEFFRNFQNQKKMDEIYALDKRLSVSSLDILDNIFRSNP